MPKEIDPKNSSRAMAFELWVKARDPMVTFFKTLDVTNLLTVSKNKKSKICRNQNAKTYRNKKNPAFCLF